MPGIGLAWLTGNAILFWRSWKQDQRLPIPGQLIAANFVFIALALLAEAERARFLATALAWGFDVAALLNVLPQIATGQTNTSANPISTAVAGKAG